jgi:tetratricopeptide (TPR) repeat protein
MSASALDMPELDDDEFEDDEVATPPRRRSLTAFGWLRVLAALPAVAAIVAAAIVAATPRGQIENVYRKQAFEALSAQQWKRASVGAERLLQLSPFNLEYRFWLALAQDGQGDKTSSTALMEALAPRDRAGYGPAHFWQADRLLRQEPLTQAAVREAELHLRRVDPKEMHSEAVMRRMALVLLKTNRLEDAREHLVGADMDANPDLRVVYAEALIARGRLEDAERELKKAMEELRDRVNRLGKSPSDGGYARRALADALVLKGEFGEAERVFQEGVVIGPAERYARPMAQFYGKWLTAAEVRQMPPPKRASVESAIDLLGKNNDGTLLSNGILSFLCQQVGRHDDAIRLLEKLAKTNPDASFDLVRLYSRQNRMDEAKKAAASASTLLAKLVEKNPEDVGLRERYAETLLLIGDFKTAVATIEEGKKRVNRPELNSPLARAYVAWWDAVAAGKAEAVGPQLDLLKKAIDAEPWNPLVFSRLAAIQGPDATAARSMVTGLLAKGESPPAAIHWILGNEAWTRGDKRLARSHMEQAFAMAPGNPLVLNNLAWMVAFSGPPDVPRALKLAEDGVRIAPKAIELRDTRGRIYAKAGEWQKALADLQVCLPVKKNDPEFLAVLAKACDKCGLADLAKEYRKQAEQLLKNQPIPRPTQPAAQARE